MQIYQNLSVTHSLIGRSSLQRESDVTLGLGTV